MLVSFLLISTVAAAWYFVIQGGVRVNVASIGSYKDVILTLPNINLNTTNSSDKGNTSSCFAYNRAGTFQIDITETVGDLSGGTCTNGASDCTTIYTFQYGSGYTVLTNKMNVTIPENTYQKCVNVNMTCVPYSCPQTRDIVFKMTQIS